MTIDMVVTLVVMLAVVVVLARELVSPPATMLGAVVLLVVVGVAEPEVAFAGFSERATLTIAGLFVVARALQVHGGLERGLRRLLSDAGERLALARLVAGTAALSTVIANTPIVATLAPMVRDWAERNGRSPSRYLMPLSFAALLGGVVTTIGTSTTLVVSGLVSASGEPGLSFFEVTPVGLPVAVAGAMAMVLLAPRLLPERRATFALDASTQRDYAVGMQVQPGGPLDGATIAEAGLRNLDDVFVAAIAKGGEPPRPARPGTRLSGGDVLTFVGGVDHVQSVTATPGLVLSADTQAGLLETDDEAFVEAVIGPTSPLVGRTPKEASFRGRYAAAILAVHRDGARVEGQLGEVVFESGDVLLLLTDADFVERWQPRRDFAVLVPHLADDPAPSRHRGLVIAITVAMVVAAAAGVDLIVAVLGACLVLGATRIVRFWDARSSLDLDVLIIVASAIGLGGIVASSGLAAEVAAVIEAVATSTNALVALAAVLLGTLVLTEIVTNVAASALMVPIAMDVATRVGEDPRGWAIGVAMMASASFLTPIGYQTNTIVYGLGGYRFGDYWRLGLPLTVTAFVSALAVIPVVW